MLLLHFEWAIIRFIIIVIKFVLDYTMSDYTRYIFPKSPTRFLQ